LAQEHIVGSPDMTPALIKAEAKKAGLPSTTSFPTVSVAGHLQIGPQSRDDDRSKVRVVVHRPDLRGAPQLLREIDRRLDRGSGIAGGHPPILYGNPSILNATIPSLCQ